MADPRFYDNRGPFTVAEVCARAGVPLPADADAGFGIDDVAALESAGATQLGFCIGRGGLAVIAVSRAGHCFATADVAGSGKVPAGMVTIVCASPGHAFATTVSLFYPDHSLARWTQRSAINPSARIAEGVQLGPGVVIGPHVEIGAGTRLGPNAVIGRGVTIGRDCEIGSNVTITHAHLGDRVVVQPGAQIGQPGFGFASDARGHLKIPQIGRVIVQDNVEIGACSTVDRAALGDTVIGDGTKIDNLVQIGHNSKLGRHVIMAGQAGVAGSAELGDFVIVGGQTGIADHAKVGDGARLAGKTGVVPGTLEGGKDYGGVPARPARQWLREQSILASLAKRDKRDGNG